jgi:hypothetical protein
MKFSGTALTLTRQIKYNKKAAMSKKPGRNFPGQDPMIAHAGSWAGVFRTFCAKEKPGSFSRKHMRI